MFDTGAEGRSALGSNPVSHKTQQFMRRYLPEQSIRSEADIKGTLTALPANKGVTQKLRETQKRLTLPVQSIWIA